MVGVLIEKGATLNPYLQTIINNMPRKPGHNRNSGIWIDPMKLLPTTQRNVFHTYAGSLTTPPCSEGVSWYVLDKPIAATEAQIRQLELLEHINNRYPLPLNGRKVAGTQ